WILLAAAALLGCYAAATSLATPVATSLTLAGITVAGAVIAWAPRAARFEPGSQLEPVARRVTDAAEGGALFALPGAAASGAAILFTGAAREAGPGTIGATSAVLALSFLALALSLSVAAITQVARRESSPSLLVGATGGAVAVLVAALVAEGATALDLVV